MGGRGLLLLLVVSQLCCGDRAHHSPAGDPVAAQVGQWSAVEPWPALAVHTLLLPSGRVMWWPEDDAPREWNPATDLQRDLPHAGYNLFCGGQTFLADGRVIAAGGADASNIEDTGVNSASTYDWVSNTWTRLPDMNDRRWYPTNTALANGDALVIAGSITSGQENTLPQVWQVGSGSWRDLTGARRVLPTYPWMFVALNGQVFYAGPTFSSAYLDTAGTGAWTDLAPRVESDRTFGSAVMYGDGKVLIEGGVNFDTASMTALADAEVIDLGATVPTWRRVGAMNRGRSNSNSTLLPDGKVLVTGGHSGASTDDPSQAVLEAEMWDPATEQFTLLAPASVYRGYHSTAVLLPDGRVLSAGGFSGQTSAEIFSPPYLFLGPRPTITSAPSEVAYGQTFVVGTPDADAITQVTWVRLSAVTHSFNQNQRFNRLAFTRGSGQLSVTAPALGNQAPPGHYMLFILNGSGVPSVASIVRLGATSGGGGMPDAGVDAGDAGVDGGTLGVLFHDDFNRTGALGSNWVVAHGAFSDDGTVATGTAPQSYAFWIGQPDVNGTVSIQIGSSASNTYYGVTARANLAAPDRDHYAGYVDPDGVFGIARRDNYGYTYLATGGAVGAGRHVLSLTATGTTTVDLSLKLDGVEVLHATDASANARRSGMVGIFDYNGIRQPLDEFLVTTAAGSTPDGGVPDGGVIGDAAVIDAAPVDASSEMILFEDQFDRTGALGSSWSVAHGAFRANGVVALGTAPQSYAFWAGQPGVNDTVSLQIGPPLANTYYGVTVRANPAAPDRDHYAGYVDPYGVLGIARRDNYAYAYLATGGAISSGTHMLSLTATGTTSVGLSLKLDGVEVLRATDASANARASGIVGMFDYNGTSQPLDDFTVRR